MLSDETIRSRLDSGDLVVNDLLSLEEQLQPAGLDLRVGADYKHAATGRVLNANNNHGNVLTLKPNTFYRVHTVEYVEMPADLVGHVSGRFTVERQGIEVSSGPIDPGFEGVLELGVFNKTEEPIHIDAGSPFAQVSFTELDQPARTPYGEMDSSQYQGQEGLSESTDD